jgi:hypothetical protein
MILDKLGQEITPGCIIAYGHALGRCAGIRIGKVIKVEQREEEHWHNKEKYFIYRVTVHGVDDDWSHNEPELTAKRGTLQFPERMIVLDPNKVPEKLKKLLDTVQIGQ